MTGIKVYHTGAIILLASALAGCANVTRQTSDRSEEKPVVVVSIPPLEYFVEKIGGDKVKVECLAPASADPETFEPSMAQLKTASQAQLMLNVGLLPFERKVSEAISASNKKISVFALADSIELIEGTHDHDHGHHDNDANTGNYDPHVWTSLRNARVMARNTCRVLSRCFPDDSLYFQKRLDMLDRRLDSLDRSVATRLLPRKGKSFLVWHPSLSYFARDYGLRQLAVGNEHKESSMTGLKERLDKIRQARPLVFFYQREYDSRQAETISEATGLRPVVITPLSADIEEAVTKAADALAPLPLPATSSSLTPIKPEE